MEKGAGFKVPFPEGEGFSGVFIRGFPPNKKTTRQGEGCLKSGMLPLDV